MRRTPVPLPPFSHAVSYTAIGIAVGICLNPLLSLLGVSSNIFLFIDCLVVVILMVMTIVLASHNNDFSNGIGKIPPLETIEAPGVGRCDKESCAQIVRQFKLTEREKEVFVLLAKGRNAEVIARELVISQHTSKTHIYHIYKKLKLQSQQELIDFVEGRTTASLVS